MLRNPIYVGDFVWKGQHKTGKHDPTISRALFDRVQRVLGDRQKPMKRVHSFAFRGFVRCGTCGCAITAERKKGKYVYYCCTRSRGNCDEKPVREERLAELLGEPLKRLRVTEERLEWILRGLRESHADQKSFRVSETTRLRSEAERLRRKLDLLYEDKLSGAVSPGFWARKHRDFTEKQHQVLVRIEEHESATNEYTLDGARILELSKDACSLYVRQDVWEKRKLLDLTLSNFGLIKLHMCVVCGDSGRYLPLDMR